MKARVTSRLLMYSRRVIRMSCVNLTFLSVFVAPPDEKEVDGKIWIEFDDGDSGFFQLNEIKRIRPDFPVEGKHVLYSPCSATQVTRKALRVLLPGVRPVPSVTLAGCCIPGVYRGPVRVAKVPRPHYTREI